MIKTSRQLKDLIRNKAKGDSDKSGLLIRNYGMERFWSALPSRSTRIILS